MHVHTDIKYAYPALMPACAAAEPALTSFTSAPKNLSIVQKDLLLLLGNSCGDGSTNILFQLRDSTKRRNAANASHDDRRDQA